MKIECSLCNKVLFTVRTKGTYPKIVCLPCFQSKHADTSGLREKLKTAQAHAQKIVDLF